MRLGTFTWQLPNHRKKRKERRQRRKTKKKKKNSAQLAAVHYQDKKMERAQTGERTQQAQRSISSSCGLLWRLRPEAERWQSGSAERALGKDDHCAASVAGIFLSKGKQVGASFTLDAAGGRFSDDLSSFFSGNQSSLWKSWNVGLVLLPPLFTYPRVPPPRISWKLCQNETLEDKLENAVSSSSGRTGGVTFLKEAHNS